MTTQPSTTQTAEEASGRNTVVETTKTTARDVKLAFLAVGALIECGAIPLPNLLQEGWHQEISIAIMSVAAAFAAAGVSS